MGPLVGIRVVELSSGIAGPIAGMLLGDFGAEVVKVEPPAGDPARALPGFAVWNRNKLSVVIDHSSAADRQRLNAMLAAADICIMGETLQALAGAELAPDALTAANPRLVLVHMPPYLPDHTPWAGERESSDLLSAVGGPSCRQSSFDGGPVQLIYPFPLYIQGHWGAACAVAALIERERSGCGQVVTVAGIHGVMVSAPQSLVLDPAQSPLSTAVGPGGRHPTYSTYKCGDGQWLFLAALTPKFQVNAFRVLGLGNLLTDPRLAGEPARMLLPDNREWVHGLLEQAFVTRTREEWLRLLEEGDCPAGPTCDRDQWFDHPQVAANHLLVELDDPERGPLRMPGVTIALTETPGSVRSLAPELGQHTETAGRWPPSAVEPAPRPGPTGSGPLAGFRILDMGTILAGPYAGSLLTELGAEVIKVEAPSGDAFRETGFIYNRGMRGLAIDLSSQDGQQAFHQLVRTADAVIDNSRQGVLKRLRADYETLAQHHPGIVCLSIAGFGERGPLAHKPAFDPVLQAMSGMMTAQGGDSDPVLFAIPINDVAAAATSALGVCLGLLHRLRSGKGQRAVTSLAAMSLMMQSGELVRIPGRSPALVGGRDFAGPCAAQRFYQTADGWIRVQADSSDALPLEQDGSALAEWLVNKPSVEALDGLAKAGIPAAPARHPLDLSRDPEIQAADVFVQQVLPNGTPYLTPHRYAWFSRTQERGIFVPPGLGEHSRAVLLEAGLDERRIGDLIESGIVKQGAPAQLRGLVNYR